MILRGLLTGGAGEDEGVGGGSLFWREDFSVLQLVTRMEVREALLPGQAEVVLLHAEEVFPIEFSKLGLGVCGRLEILRIHVWDRHQVHGGIELLPAGSHDACGGFAREGLLFDGIPVLRVAGFGRLGGGRGCFGFRVSSSVLGGSGGGGAAGGGAAPSFGNGALEEPPGTGGIGPAIFLHGGLDLVDLIEFVFGARYREELEEVWLFLFSSVRSSRS